MFFKKLAFFEGLLDQQFNSLVGFLASPKFGDEGKYLGVDREGNMSRVGGDLELSLEPEKTLKLKTPVYQDIDFPIIARTAAVNNPTPATLVGNLTAPTWAVNDFLMCEGQELVHLWKVGSPWTWHIHLITNGTEATDKFVKFEVEFAYAVPDAALSSVQTLTSQDLLIPANTPDRPILPYRYRHLLPQRR